MRSGLVSVVLVLLFVAVPFGQMFSEELESLDNSEFAASAPFDILMYGNSYTSANNLANLVQDGLVSGGVSATVDSLTGGGMTLDGHSQNAQSSGHSWNTTLNDGTAWDYVVLQDQSQIPGLYRNTAYWQDSLAGAQALDGFAEDVGAESILMMTWGRRNGDTNNQVLYPDFLTMQERLEDGYIDYRDNLSTPNRDIWIAPVGLAFKHVYENVQASGATPENSGNLFYDLYSGDGSHPSLSGSYLASCVLYATITGNSPVGLTDSTSLSASIKLDLQEAAAATVFNETHHLSYSWQITSQNNSASSGGNLAWEWVLLGTGGSQQWDRIFEVVTSPSGDVFAIGLYTGSINFPGNTACNAQHPDPQYYALFVVKFDSFGFCKWVATGQGGSGSGYVPGDFEFDRKPSLNLDNNDDIYVSTHVTGHTTTPFYFGNITHYAPNFQKGILAKLNNNGSWEWVTSLGQSGPNSIVTDSNNDIWASFRHASNSNSLIAKLNSSGDVIFTKIISASGEVNIRDLETDSFGDIYAAGDYSGYISIECNGNTLDFSATDLDLYVLKLNNTGDCIWFSTESNSVSSSYATSLVVSSNNGYLSEIEHDSLLHVNL